MNDAEKLSPLANPLANALKTGTAADFPRIPDDLAAFQPRLLAWYSSFRPQDTFHCWLTEQITMTSLRLEHLDRVERRSRDRVALQAQLFWDDDRQLDAEKLGAGLAGNPAVAVNRLRRTPQGCDWLIKRWASLAKHAEQGSVWNSQQQRLALNLLGKDQAACDGIDIDLARPTTELAALARQHLTALAEQKVKVTPLDAIDKAMAQNDYLDQPTEELRRLFRHESALHRRLKWYINLINTKPLHNHTNPSVYSYFNYAAEPEKSAQAPPEPSILSKIKQIDPLATVNRPEIKIVEPDYIAPSRPDPRLLKAENRREVKRRRQERLRA